MRASAAQVLVIGAAAAMSLAGADAMAARTGAAIEEGACGKPGEAPCPLEKWMRVNMAAKLADGDMDALARGLEKAAKLAPDPAWSSWPTLAMSGAAAAGKGRRRGGARGVQGLPRRVARRVPREVPAPHDRRRRSPKRINRAVSRSLWGIAKKIFLLLI